MLPPIEPHRSTTARGCLLDILVRIPFIDIWPDMPKSSRREEVLSWLERYPKVDRYVVVNDEDGELEDPPPFQPSGRTGPTRKLLRGRGAISERQDRPHHARDNPCARTAGARYPPVVQQRRTRSFRISKVCSPTFARDVAASTQGFCDTAGTDCLRPD
jgi:hypothetical protein